MEPTRESGGQSPCTESVEDRPGFKENQRSLVREGRRDFVITKNSVKGNCNGSRYQTAKSVPETKFLANPKKAMS